LPESRLAAKWATRSSPASCVRALTTIEGAVDFSRMRANLTGIGFETGYGQVLGSNHFGRNIVPSHALFQVSGAPGGGD
jgi:hypothetical protein